MAGASIARPQDVPSAVNANPATLAQFLGTQFTMSGACVVGQRRAQVEHLNHVTDAVINQSGAVQLVLRRNHSSNIDSFRKIKIGVLFEQSSLDLWHQFGRVGVVNLFQYDIR